MASRKKVISHKSKGKVKRDRVVKTLGHRSKFLILQQFASGILIFAGFVFIMYAASKNFNFSLYKEVKEAKQEIEKQENRDYKAISINIPKIDRNLQIVDGTFKDGRWEVSPTEVSYYTDSSLPNKGGNTVLYGHNKKVILGPLTALMRGDNIELTLEDGSVLKYEVFETKQVKPNAVEILKDTGDNRLTIYTCTGFLDSARFVVVAKLAVS